MPLLLYVLLCVCFFFFFKQKTAYEMRISDWSSDVCSSDLLVVRNRMAVGIEHGELYPVALCGGKISNHINSCIMREQMFRTIGELIRPGSAMKPVASHAAFDQDIAYIAIERLIAVSAIDKIITTTPERKSVG